MKRIATLSILCAVSSLRLVVACSMDAPSRPAQSGAGQGTWSAKAPLPIKISESAVAVAGGKIYVLGGTTADVVDHRLNYEYDPETDHWRAD